MNPLAEIFPVLIERHGDIPEVQQGILRIAWNYCVGEKIRQATVPVDFTNGILMVRVADKQWQLTLDSMKPDIIDKINKYLRRRILVDLQIEIG